MAPRDYLSIEAHARALFGTLNVAKGDHKVDTAKALYTQILAYRALPGVVRNNLLPIYDKDLEKQVREILPLATINELITSFEGR